jgi:hypothetical protein
MNVNSSCHLVVGNRVIQAQKYEGGGESSRLLSFTIFCTNYLFNCFLIPFLLVWYKQCYLFTSLIHVYTFLQLSPHRIQYIFSAGLNTVDFTVSFLTVLYISMVKNSEKRYHAVEINHVFPCFMSGGGCSCWLLTYGSISSTKHSIAWIFKYNINTYIFVKLRNQAGDIYEI